jgi:spore maturation protein CgeB
MFYHSLVSDWNHGNAHFLRGIATELLNRGHHVDVFEPANGWSRSNLISQYGDRAIHDFKQAYPGLTSLTYDPETSDLDPILEDADVVLVHEWNPASIIERIGEHRKRAKYRVYFHDTHHRCVSDAHFKVPQNYDGILVYGESLRRRYERKGWASRIWVWHEAADTRVFKPSDRAARCGDLVWVGNWGDDERTRELNEFLFEPVRNLKLHGCVYGVRYPEEALRRLATSGLRYAGWVANFRVPHIFSGFDMTIHVPRRPYREQLPGVPTIRVFEALACGIPLVSSPWDDCEHLFERGRDYLVAENTAEMTDMLAQLSQNEALRRELAEHGLSTIRTRHTCVHRTDQLLEIVRQ